jgi:hypothetical protein
VNKAGAATDSPQKEGHMEKITLDTVTSENAGTGCNDVCLYVGSEEKGI